MTKLTDKDKAYLADRGLIFEEVTEGARVGVVFRNYQLPNGRYNACASSLLIILPDGYNGVAPDMFYLNPPVGLTSGGTPTATSVTGPMFGQPWQQWSRHWQGNWRPYIDGIWTILERVKRALDKG